MDNTTTIWIIVVVSAVALVIISALIAQRRARLRSAELREHFGPESDRAVSELGSPARAG
jgi:nitrogen fixation/metabolism regulation signal transduction histidine kinase